MKPFIFYYSICLFFNVTFLYGQNGPAGIGNTSGSSGLKLWLNTDVSLNGTSISEWNDLSGNNLKAIQASDSLQPKYLENESCNQAAIEFDGENDVLDMGDALEDVFNGSNKKFTIFIVVKDLDSLKTNYLFVKRAATDCGEDQREFYFAVCNNKVRQSTHYSLDLSSYVVVEGANSLNTGVNVLTFLYDGSISGWLNRFNFYLNGYLNPLSLLSYSGTPGEISNSTSHLGIGNSISSVGIECTNNFNLKGKLFELIIYNYALESTERVTVENYLMGKYKGCLIAGINNNSSKSSDIISQGNIIFKGSDPFLKIDTGNAKEVFVELIDQFGIQIKSISKDEINSGKIDLAAYPSGLYFLKANFDERIIVEKIVIE